VEYNFYRLKMVDLDNTFEYSEVVLVKNAGIQQDVFIAGNPVADQLTIQFARIPDGKVSVAVYDMKGSRIFQKQFGSISQPTLPINLGNRAMAHGIYSVKVEVGGKTYNLKAMK
jgi:hypothetical protein